MATRFILKDGELRQTSSGGTAILKFLFLAIFRFFLGKPMNGKRMDNSTFLKGATKGRPGGRPLTRWQKKPQAHRGLIRVAVSLPMVGILVLTIYSRLDALLVLAFSSPFLVILAYRKGRLLFFDPYTYTDAENGARTQCWALKNKWRKLIRMQPIPGLVTRKTRIDPDLAPELQEYVRRTINESGQSMPMLGKVQRYRRDRKVKEVMTE
jgi:hypothetical protein